KQAINIGLGIQQTLINGLISIVDPIQMCKEVGVDHQESINVVWGLLISQLNYGEHNSKVQIFIVVIDLILVPTLIYLMITITQPNYGLQRLKQNLVKCMDKKFHIQLILLFMEKMGMVLQSLKKVNHMI